MLKKTLILVLFTLMIVSGCTNTQKTNEEPITETNNNESVDETPISSKNDPVNDNESTTPAPIDNSIPDFETILQQSENAADLLDYLNTYIEDLDTTTVESAIEWLVLYQSEPIEYINSHLYESKFTETFYNDMNAEITPEKVAKLKDSPEKELMQLIVDNGLTIVTYEESPVAEINWALISEFSGSVSQLYGQMLELSSKYQRYYSDSYSEMLSDALWLEANIPNAIEPFLHSRLKNLHSDLISKLFVGPEGSFIGTFVEKQTSPYTSDLYNALIDFEKNNSDSYIGSLVRDLNTNVASWEDEPTQIISRYMSFGFGSDLYWENKEVNYDGVTVYMPKLMARASTSVIDKINNDIQTYADTTMANNIGGQTIELSLYTNYSSEHFVSISAFIYMSDPNATTQYISDNLLFDMKTGNRVTLHELLNVDENNLLSLINAETGLSFDTITTFGMRYDGSISIESYNPDLGFNEFAVLTLKDLSKYMDKALLYW